MSIFAENVKAAMVSHEETFWIGETEDVEVIVNVYEDSGVTKMTAWLNGTEEINTIVYNGPLDDRDKLLEAMGKLVHDNEDYILSLADWDGE